MARKKNRFNAVRKEEIRQESLAETWRTALYARLSVELLNRKSESIENQLELMKRFAKGKPEFTELLEYTDRGYSGTDFHRPAFEQLMEDVRNGKINCIIVKDLSRLGRDYLETSNYVEVIFPFMGVRFISVNDHFDTNEEQNGNKELEIALKNLVNDMYARDVSKRVSTTREHEQVRGKFLGSNAPYGYKVDDKHPLRRLVIDPPAAEIVRQIYAMVLEGLSVREISLSLQEQKVSIPGQYLKTGHLYREPGDKATKWYTGTIANILHARTYVGDLVQGRRRTRHYKGEERHFTDRDEWLICENTHEAIVSREVYDRVQEILAEKVENSTFSSDRTRDIPIKPNRYKGILFCGICGAKLSYHSAVIGPDNQRKYSFHCSKSYDLEIEQHIGIHITEETLEALLKEIIGDLLRSFNEESGQLVLIMEKEMKKGLEAWKKDIRKVTNRLNSIDADAAARYESYVFGTLSRDTYMENRSSSEEQRQKMESRLHELEDKCTGYEASVRAKIKWLLGLEEASEGDLDEELIQLLISRIELHPEHELRITWSFPEEDIRRLKKGGAS